MKINVRKSRFLIKQLSFLSLATIALLLPRPVVASLFVSNLGTGRVSLYADNGSLIESNFLTGGSGGGGGEGITCILNVAGVPTLFVANNSNTIFSYNAVTGVYIGPFATANGASFAAISLTPNGSTLYAAGQDGSIYGFNTLNGDQTYKSLSPSPEWHDVAVDPISPSQVYAVYATQGIGNFSQLSKLGINRATPPATTLTPFKPWPPLNATSGDYSGMVFDSTGNLWVTNFSTGPTNNLVQPGIYEFDSQANLITSITSNLFNHPLGLAINPADNNVYVANLLNDNILKIVVDPSDPSKNSIGVFLTEPTGSRPKYLAFNQNCCSATVPAPLPLFGISAAFSYSRKFRNQIKTSKNLRLMSAID